MKKRFFCFLFLLLLVSSVSAQDIDAKLITEFGRLSCGDFMARMDNLAIGIKKFPDSQIYVIYYGGRYRRTSIDSERGTIIALKYPHREDGLNYAKSIPLYLKTLPTIEEVQIALIDGGFREKTEVEIWAVPKNGDLPSPTATIDEKDIKFRKDKPYGTPNYTDCYGDYAVLR